MDAGPAGVEAPETLSAGQLQCAAEFVASDAAVDLREAQLGFGFMRAIILVHHVDVSARRYVIGDPVHDFAGVIEQAGHDQMAQENPAQRKTVLVHSQFADLRVHRGNHIARGFGIIAGNKIFPAMLGVPEFEIGHVNVHDPVHPSNAFEAVVSRGVVNEREMQTAFDGDHERFQNLRHDVLGRDEVDVVATNSLQIEHDPRKRGSANFGAFAKLAGLKILAKDTTQIAPAEKDRA
jgi:hypothetical protein